MEYFFNEFRKEHRIIRDLLLDLITSFILRDWSQSEQLRLKLDRITGYHFQYEEEALYPALGTFFGEPYIYKLLTDHDLAIARAIKLKSLIDKRQNNDSDFTEAINLVRAILPHVSDCEGLTIMVEKLEKVKIDTIIKAIEKARNSNESLLKWAQSERNRKILTIN